MTASALINDTACARSPTRLRFTARRRFRHAFRVSPRCNPPPAAAGIDAVYLPLPAVDADDFRRRPRDGTRRQRDDSSRLVVDRVDDVDATVRRIGAINTIRVENGRWQARNTDAYGFLHPLLNHVELEGRHAAILGAGGAARAVAVALRSEGCAVRVHARQRPQAEEVAALVTASVGSWPPEPDSWDLLVNCTPIGTYPNVDDTPLPAERLTGSVVYDLVYNPPSTRLLREAAARGCHTIGGLDMLVGRRTSNYGGPAPCLPPGVMRQAATEG